MTALATGAVSRAVRGITVDAITSLDKKRQQLGFDSLGELEQQFQLAIEGTAAQTIAWEEREIKFNVEFYDATEQRDSSFTVPHVTYGAVITSDDPVMISVCVREWNERSDRAIVGATVAVGATNPGGSQVDFEGYVHITFQGYGAPTEDAATMDTN